MHVASMNEAMHIVHTKSIVAAKMQIHVKFQLPARVDSFCGEDVLHTLLYVNSYKDTVFFG